MKKLLVSAAILIAGFVIVNMNDVLGEFANNSGVMKVQILELWAAAQPGPSGARELTWTARANMPTGRAAPGVAFAKERIYIIGGSVPPTQTAAVEAYDPVTDTWSRKASLPTQRNSLGAGALGGVIYAIGGWNGMRLPIVEAYDTVRDEWTSKAALPEEREGLGVAVSNERLFVIGGVTNDGTFLATVLEYLPEEDTWIPWAPMPTPRVLFGVVTGPDGLIYTIGGEAQSGTSAAVEAYDPVTDTWSRKASLPTARRALAAVFVNGRIYAAGGENALGQSLAIVEEYDPATDTWTPRTGMPTARAYPVAGDFGGKFYVVGGWACGGCPGLAINEEANTPVPTITSFTASPSSGILPSSGAGVQVTFTVVASDPDGPIVQAQWDFNGDGTVDRVTTTLTTSFTYTTAGTFHPSVTVMDNNGAMVSVATTVTIETPLQAINNLNTSVQGLSLNSGQKNSLNSSLNAASAAITQGHLTPACNQLQAFISQMNALVQSKQLDQATGNALIGEAQAIKTAIGCS